MARHESRQRDPEEIGDAKHAYRLKASTAQGGPKKRYKYTLKVSLKDFDIPVGSWEQTAQERSKWRGLINKGATLYEGKRICEAERKRRERNAKVFSRCHDIDLLYLQPTV